MPLHFVPDPRHELADVLEFLLLVRSRTARLRWGDARWLCVGSQRARRGFSALTSGAGRVGFLRVDRGSTGCVRKNAAVNAAADAHANLVQLSLRLRPTKSLIPRIGSIGHLSWAAR
jgi:hypothetical protein